jgi:hypothetical protein
MVFAEGGCGWGGRGANSKDSKKIVFFSVSAPNFSFVTHAFHVFKDYLFVFSFLLNIFFHLC